MQHSICNEASATRGKTTCSYATFQVRGDYLPSRTADGWSKTPGQSNIPQRAQEAHLIQQSELNDLVQATSRTSRIKTAAVEIAS